MPREKAGHLRGAGKTFAIVIGRFNELVTSRLLAGALDCLVRHDVAEKDIHIYWVPGSFEIPQATKQAVGTKVDAVICLGALIRGESAHFDILANQVVRDVSNVALDSGKPVTFGVITAETQEQALDRAGAKSGNKGWQAALSALEMADLWKEMKR
jgi:6,7-dimethyl-8-ribityllumazine synthase